MNHDKSSVETSYGWAGSANHLINTSDPEVMAVLKNAHQILQNETASKSQIAAWKESIKAVKQAIQHLISKNRSFENLGVVFEYELPRERGRRPDVILISDDYLVVLEFKGYGFASRAFIDQVSAYARDLQHYHAASHGVKILPVLVLSRVDDSNTKSDDVRIVDVDQLGHLFDKEMIGAPRDLIDWEVWVNADYAPLPNIVSAARQLFRHESLPAIRRAHSAGIPETIAKLVEIAQLARTNQEKHLVLITGVPGAGKTLAGLQLVYDNYFGDVGSERTAVFLSGNGPLVEVLQHALNSKVFVQDVHGFLKQYGGSSSRIPEEHIWIFDEAQRAWDADRVSGKRGKKLSEPEDFLWIGEKKTDWTMMVGLIGEGQEIHLGEEAGLGQWADAIKSMPSSWVVSCPPHVEVLFSEIEAVRTFLELDLNVSLRSHLAEDVQDWVRLLLEGQIVSAAETSRKIHEQGFCMYITRDLEIAKVYVRERYTEAHDKRYGLMASSKAKQLPKYGVDNDFQSTRRVKKGPWYNDEPESEKSCCQLTEVVTEFACQGLELDCPIVCWGGDLIWDGAGWMSLAQPRSKARDPHNLRVNSYRVLLTRGRDGFVIFVPDVPAANKTATALAEAGVRTLV